MGLRPKGNFRGQISDCRFDAKQAITYSTSSKRFEHKQGSEVAVRVKIEGIISLADARAALRYGADALGFVFAKSPRQIEVKKAKRIVANIGPFVQTVGLFVDASIDEIMATGNAVGFDVLQLHGCETAQWINDHLDAPFLKVFKPRRAAFTGDIEKFRAELDRPGQLRAIVLDAYDPKLAGGTGKKLPWEWIARARTAGKLKKLPSIILAGGLTPDNVAEAVRIAKPAAVDVASGVESRPGKKDYGKLRDFIAAAKGTPGT